MEDRRLTPTQHLNELRSRVLKSFAFFVVASCLFYSRVEKILPFITRPIGKLVFLEPAELFITYVKISFFGGLFFSSPFIIYQFWQFVSSALRPKEKRYILMFAPFSFTFFILGACFGYFIIIPIGLKFLLGFATDMVIPMITISKYISFVTALTLAFAVAFQLPIVILVLTKIGLVTPRFLAAKRRHATVAIFIVAAILTPPDVITQILLALPLLALYEVGIIFSKIAYRVL